MDRRDAIKSAILSAATAATTVPAAATVVEVHHAEGGRLIGVLQIEEPVSPSTFARIKG